MIDLTARRQRYECDSLMTQFGGLASNLNRIAWHAQQASSSGVAPVFRESKYFTEWAASRCTEEQLVLLADLQFELACWERGWGARLDCSTIARDATVWSNRLLEEAGLK